MKIEICFLYKVVSYSREPTVFTPRNLRCNNWWLCYHTVSVKEEPKKTSSEKYIVMFQYDAINDDELNLRVGDIVMVTNKAVCEGWWEGQLRGKTGVFPDNFVQPVPSEESTTKDKVGTQIFLSICVGSFWLCINSSWTSRTLSFRLFLGITFFRDMMLVWIFSLKVWEVTSGNFKTVQSNPWKWGSLVCFLAAMKHVRLGKIFMWLIVYAQF